MILPNRHLSVWSCCLFLISLAVLARLGRPPHVSLPTSAYVSPPTTALRLTADRLLLYISLLPIAQRDRQPASTSRSSLPLRVLACSGTQPSSLQELPFELTARTYLQCYNAK
jgi:hypothetical protein